MLKIFQDGREFYDDATGNVVFIASSPVKDGDLNAAKIARQEFCDWTDRIDLDYDWA